MAREATVIERGTCHADANAALITRLTEGGRRRAREGVENKWQPAELSNSCGRLTPESSFQAANGWVATPRHLPPPITTFSLSSPQPPKPSIHPHPAAPTSPTPDPLSFCHIEPPHHPQWVKKAHINGGFNQTAHAEAVYSINSICMKQRCVWTAGELRNLVGCVRKIAPELMVLH